nr:uncharacterized protein LOC112019674 [Quercus suber]
MIAATLPSVLLATIVAASNSSMCRDYVLISTRGTSEPQGSSIAFKSMINTTLATIAGGIEYDTVYPAFYNLTGAFVGTADISRFINDGVAACPRQKYALLGYSQGALVTAIALNKNFSDPASAAYQAVQAIVVVGNPGHVYGAAANVDEHGGATTRNFTGSYYLGGTGAIPAQYYADGKVLDICYQGDVVCALPPNGTLAILPPHLLYGSTPHVQAMGAEFLIRKLAAPPSNVTSSLSPPGSTASVSVLGTGTTPLRPTGSGSPKPAETASVPYRSAAVAASTSFGFGICFIVAAGIITALL